MYKFNDLKENRFKVKVTKITFLYYTVTSYLLHTSSIHHPTISSSNNNEATNCTE